MQESNNRPLLLLGMFAVAISLGSCSKLRRSGTPAKGVGGGAPGASSTAPSAVHNEDLETGPRAPLFSDLGSYHYEISTDVPVVQRYFDQGLIMHMGFNHAEAARSFRQAASLDPTCAMCFAGLALTLGPNYNAAMDPDHAEEAHRAAQQALSLSDSATEKERAYVRAIAARYPKPGSGAPLPDNEAYARAMAHVAAKFPDDASVASLYAEALMVLHPWDLWTRDNKAKPWTPKIISVIEGALQEDPRQPLANHLYIHVQEAGPNPEKALPSAKLLEDLVPAAGHLVHMPSHVYIRTGDYHAASLANERAIAADEKYLEEVETQGAYPLAYYPHLYHFLWATAMLEGRSERALEAARATVARADRQMMRKPGFGTLQHYSSIYYYALVAFGRHDEILAEKEPPEDLSYPRAIWHYARGMAFAAKGRINEAEQELDFVSEVARGDDLKSLSIWDINSLDSLVEIAETLLRAEISAAGGDNEAALEYAARAVELEDALNYDEPPPWGPAVRRYHGALLLANGQPGAAERVYLEDLDEFPKNGWSLFGLLESLRAQGKSTAAREVEAQFKTAWRHADVVLNRSRL